MGWTNTYLQNMWQNWLQQSSSIMTVLIYALFFSQYFSHKVNSILKN